MKAEAKQVTTVDEYIAGYPKNVQKLLKQMRATIKKAAPGAEEVLSYHMPAYKYKGMLVYFAAHTSHIGFYPMAAAIEKFKNEIKGYTTSKGTIQFPFEQDLPLALITKIVKLRIKENEEKEALKKKK